MSKRKKIRISSKKAITKIYAVVLAAVILVAAVIAVWYIYQPRETGKKKVTVLVTAEFSEEFSDYWPWTWEEFTRRTGIEVEVDAVSWGAYQEKCWAFLISGKPQYDLIYHCNLWLEDMYEYFLPLDDYFTADQKEDMVAGIEAGQVGGVTYSVMSYLDQRLLYYNTRLFEQAGITEEPDPVKGYTYDQILRFAEAITDTNADPPIYGWCDMTSSWGSTFIYRLFSEGGYLTDETGYPVFNSTEGVAAMEWFRDISPYTDPASLETTYYGDLAMLFATGYVGMVTIGSMHWVETFTDPAKSNIVDEVAVTKTPTGKTLRHPGVGDGWAIPKFVEDPDLAWKVFEWIALNPENLLHEQLEAGWGVCSKQVLSEPEVAGANPAIKELVETFDKHGPFEAVILKHSGEVFDIIKELPPRLYSDPTLDPKSILDDAVQEIIDKDLWKD